MLGNTKLKAPSNKTKDTRHRRKPSRVFIKNDKSRVIIQTAKQYALSSSAHGLSYIAEDGRLLIERILWIFVTTLAISFTTFQTTHLYIQWKDDPVITSLDTVALSIEEIEFPAVTICPQGSVKQIGDAVLFKQFREYVVQKKYKESNYNITLGWLKEEYTASKKSYNNAVLPEMTYDEMMMEAELFLKDVYPGAKEKPTQMIQAMTAADPQKVMESETLLSQSEETQCDSSSNLEALKTLNKQLKNDTCPDGFDKQEDGSCIHQARNGLMDYNTAEKYCNILGGARLLYFNSYENITAINRFVLEYLGKYRAGTPVWIIKMCWQL